ncbi:hypothetical protein D3C73_1385440 [compost metagenome]
MLVGYSNRNWFYRGGYFPNGDKAGLFASGNVLGYPYADYSFRPTLILGTNL